MALKSSNIKSKEREVRREELNRYLQERGKLSYVFDILEKIEDEAVELEPIMVQRLSKAVDVRLALLKKYMPDMKMLEVQVEDVTGADAWADDE